MLISPPFLLPRLLGETDDQWVARCMTGDTPGHGAYPLSHQLEWHGGLHLTAPRNGINVAAVRAIADGKVIFMRNATTVKAADEGHPLNYFSGYTSDGCVIIEHTTEIGEGTNANVVFYSVYHHLTNIPEQIAKDKRIYRKEIIGHAGHIYSEQDRFHFEICCDEVNLQKLVGRISGPLPTASNGRTDAVFGAMYFSIPDGTPVYAQQPVPYRLDGQWQAPKSPKNSAWPEIATQTAASTTVGELIMGLRYGGGEGDAPGGAELTTYRPDGSIIGEVILETDAEYNLYQTANGIVKEWARAKKADARQYPDVPAPSAVFELLRFGRIINSANEKLTPANAAHWRKVRYDGGEGWINLNAENVHQFSDADFPHWKGSLLIDDDSIASDSKCDSATIKKMLDVDGNNTVTQQEAQAKLNDVSVKGRLQRTICKFPCEWEEATLETRWGWLKNKTEENSKPYTDDEYKDVINHLKALCFACPELFAAQWRFEPREFVKKFQSCGWMSLHEMVQMLPRRIENSSNDKVELKWAAALDNLRGTNKDTRLTSTVLNKVMRK